jgi:leucyl aminopeptidase
VTAINAAAASADRVDADAIVIGIARDGDGMAIAPGAEALDAAFGHQLAAVLRSMGATGELGECHRLPAPDGVAAPLIQAVGLGEPPRRGGYSPQALRYAAGAATRQLAGRREVALALPVTGDPREAVTAIATGALLGAYAFDRYRRSSAARHEPAVESIIVLGAGRAAPVRRALQRAEVVCGAVGQARDLVNTPPSDLHPKEFAAWASGQATELGLEVEVLDERALKRGGYGGILAVGQGSVNPPRLVRIDYRHPRARRHLAFVGKGITFDSGGLSLKPTASMDWMKADMGGAAAVVAATFAIARLGFAVDVTTWAPLAENMPSGSAQRPSDVFTAYGGTTVEVLNTDAEGRLVLADGLARASEDDPDLIVDVATLTGAQVTALGSRVSAVMSNDDALRTAVVDAAGRAGEAMWPMPLPPELRKGLDSAVADIANMGETHGGMLTAATFLREFVGNRDGEQIPWAHLDIAGPSFNHDAPYGYTPRGGTGIAVRTLVQLADDVAARRI